MLNDAQIEQHSRMLYDNTRNNAFINAINYNAPSHQRAVDLGSGSGILSKYLLDANINSVTGIEYFSNTASLAKNLLKSYSERFNIICNSSYNVDLSYWNPTLLISETLGLIGPEENIVELMFDFISRHPSITSIIPINLAIKAQWINSSKIDNLKNETIKPFSTAFNTPNNTEQLELLYCSEIRTTVFNNDDTKSIDKPFTIASYKLGKDFDSAFIHELLPTDFPITANGLHIYFEADLGNNLILSSNISQLATHWGHSFIAIPQINHNMKLTIFYTTNSGKVEVKWNEKQ